MRLRAYSRNKHISISMGCTSVILCVCDWPARKQHIDLLRIFWSAKQMSLLKALATQKVIFIRRRLKKGRIYKTGSLGPTLLAMIGRPLGGPISEVTRERTHSFTTA